VASLLARLADTYAKLVENLEHVRLGCLARARTALKNLNRRCATMRDGLPSKPVSGQYDWRTTARDAMEVVAVVCKLERG
jgi:hypothetical protein